MDCSCNFGDESYKGITCKIEETGSGISISISSDDEATVDKLKKKAESFKLCCDDKCC